MNLKDLKDFVRSGYKVLTDSIMELSIEEWITLVDEYPYAFKDAQFTNVDFQDAHLHGFDFSRSRWVDSSFSGVATRCNFAGSYFERVNFNHAFIKECDFRRCTIRGMRGAEATFSRTTFRSSRISGLFLSHAKKIYNIDLHDTFIELGVLDGVDLSSVKGVSSVHVNGLEHTVYCIHSTDDSPIHFRIGYDWKRMTYFIENPEHPYSGAAKFLGGYYAKLPY